MKTISRKSPALNASLIAIIVTLSSSDLPASWADHPLEEIIARKPLVVIGEICRIEIAPKARYACDTAFINVERVLKNSDPNRTVQVGTEIPLAMPSVNNEMRLSTDLYHHKGQRGIWILNFDEGRYRAAYPKDFQPLTQESNIAAIIQQQAKLSPDPSRTSKASVQPVQTSSSAWGKTGGGLQMSLCQETNAPARSRALLVGFRNVGDTALILNLGITLANGKTLLPEAIRLTLADTQGKERLLRFSDKKYPGISGRVDDYIVSLQPGATCAIPVRLGQFWCPATGEFDVPLPNRPFRITAHFEGRSATHLNRDTEGLRLMNFWQGTLQSAPLDFESNR